MSLFEEFCEFVSNHPERDTPFLNMSHYAIMQEFGEKKRWLQPRQSHWFGDILVEASGEAIGARYFVEEYLGVGMPGVFNISTPGSGYNQNRFRTPANTFLK